MARLLALTLCLWAGADAAMSRTKAIANVVGMLTEMQTETKGAASKNAQDTAASVATCEDKADRYKATITANSDSCNCVSGALDLANADVAAEEAAIEKATSRKARAQEAITSADAARAIKSDAFDAKVKDSEAGIEAIKEAMAVIRKQISLTGLVQVNTIAHLPQEAKAVIASFIQKADKPTNALLQDAAKVTHAEAHKNGVPASDLQSILDLLDGVLKGVEKNLQTTKVNEEESLHAHNMFVQTKNNEIALLDQEMERSGTIKTRRASDATAYQTQLDGMQSLVADTQKLLDASEEECEGAAASFAAAKASLAKELKAIAAALDALAAVSGASLIQKSSTPALVQIRGTASETGRSQLVAYLQRQAEKTGEGQFALIAARVSAGDNVLKLKGIMEGLLAHLKESYKNMATQHAYCQKEAAVAMQHGAILTEKISLAQTQLDQYIASKDGHDQTIAKAQADMADVQADLAAATAARTAESAASDASIKTFTSDQAAISKAIQILKEVFGESSISTSGASIIEMLDAISEDLETEMAEAEAAETKAQGAFDSYKVEALSSIGAFQNTVAHYTAMSECNGQSIAEITSEKDADDAELAECKAEYAKLVDLCPDLTTHMTKDEATAAYEATASFKQKVIDGLWEALMLLKECS